MAFIKAKAPFSLNGLRFSTLQDYDLEFRDNINIRFEGETYQDVAQLTSGDDSGANFGGFGFQFRNNEPVSGTVQVITGDAPGGREIFYIQGLSIAATDVGRAISTNSFKDDLKIWKSAFSGADTMKLSSGNDVMRGFGGNDKMFGKGGNDKLKGDGGRDKLIGGGGNDNLKGGGGNDNLKGGKGNDKLLGGGGKDKLNGGGNDDVLIGGKGADTFIFTRQRTDETTSNADLIRDFKIGVDVIDIRTKDKNFDDLVIWEEGGNAVVAYSHGNITLRGISENQVTADMFDF